MPERFRDPPASAPPQQSTTQPKLDQYGNYLIGNNAPLMTSSESYNYLTSTVHTPVKRYIPTPPPAENFSHCEPVGGGAGGLGASLMAGLMASGGGINIINAAQAGAGGSLLKSLPYRLKVPKSADPAGLGEDTTDHY